MRIICINIDERTDRWAQCSAEFARVGLQVERMSAITGENPMLAFNQSVLKAMKLAEGDSLLLFEDDVVFDGNPHIHGPFPPDALTVHFGANIIGLDTTRWQMPSSYDRQFARLHNCYQSHSTWYSEECVSFILNNLRGDIMDAENNIFDDWLRRNVLSQGRSYITRPMICYQRPSHSDIWQTWANYTGVHGAGNKILERL